MERKCWYQTHTDVLLPKKLLVSAHLAVLRYGFTGSRPPSHPQTGHLRVCGASTPLKVRLPTSCINFSGSHSWHSLVSLSCYSNSC